MSFLRPLKEVPQKETFFEVQEGTGVPLCYLVRPPEEHRSLENVCLEGDRERVLSGEELG